MIEYKSRKEMFHLTEEGPKKTNSAFLCHTVTAIIDYAKNSRKDRKENKQ